MPSEYLIDLNNNPEAWKDTAKSKKPDGTVTSEVASIVPGEGPRNMFWMLDTLMYAMPEGTDPDLDHMPHEHRLGYETFFVDSGKMWLYIDGKKCMLTKGDILHLQAGQIHGMAFIEDVKYRGTYHDYIYSPDLGPFGKAKAYSPNDPELDKLMPSMDYIRHEPMLFKEVSADQCSAVRNPKRPLAEYRLDGVTMKILVQRWENAGITELCCAEMEPGFTAEWVKYPKERDLLYVRNGEVKFTVYDETFIAPPESIINIPKFAPHSLEALTTAEVYDLGGQTLWASFLHDYMSIKTYDPERFEKTETIANLKAGFNCQIERVGMKAGR
ncbi:MAG: cupin domain-containing protein [Clostridiales bacterium]|nr:cupin domain-containing protein [Clostridiales bacterium]